MANFDCPLCRSATDVAGKVRFCPQCGWNKKQAAQQLRYSLKVLPIALVAAAILVFLFLHTAQKKTPMVYLLSIAFPAAVYALAYASVKRSLVKLESVPDLPSDKRTPSSAAAGTMAPLVPAAKDLALLRASRPREVRMSGRGKRSLATIALLACAFEGVLIWQLHRLWALTQSFAGFHRKDWALVGLVALLVLLPLSTWRQMARERKLLENGELAMGRVTKKWNTRDGSTVFYEFQDASGQTHKHSGMDYSRTLEIGMAVPVFYDRDNPKKQVAACAALHEAVM